MTQFDAMVRRHAALPNPATADLPAAYEHACTALAACDRLDECKEWADKAAALASYARQGDDDSLHGLATRIRARAVRRCGELLQQFDGRGGDRKSNGGGTSARASQRRAAASAGMSKRQQVTAVRVANVPQDVFDAAVEHAHPPTVQALADLGTQPRPQTAPPGFKVATDVLGRLRELAAFCGEHAPAFIAGGIYPHEWPKAGEHVQAIQAWLTEFLRHRPNSRVEH